MMMKNKAKRLNGLKRDYPIPYFAAFMKDVMVKSFLNL